MFVPADDKEERSADHIQKSSWIRSRILGMSYPKTTDERRQELLKNPQAAQQIEK